MSQRARIPGWLLFVIATAFGVSSTIQAYWLDQLKHDGGMPDELPHLLALNLVYWYIPALLAPVIMAWATRDQLRPRAMARAGAGARRGRARVLRRAHGGHDGAARGAAGADRPAARLPGWWNYTLTQYLTQLDWLLMTYLFLVGLAHALAYRRESEARALNAAQLETRLVEAQLQALQRQLHPHFLFNTLNTISGLMRTDVDAADLMIDRLGDLLRMTLHTSGTQEVPLKEELDVLQKYLEIEQTRFGDRLRVDDAHRAGDARRAGAEPAAAAAGRERRSATASRRNARPGLDRRSTPSATDDQLTMQIRDSGDGLPPDRLMALNRGVGLDNTRARLEHLYPSAFQFTFSNLDDGFCVTVRIPVPGRARRLADEPVRAGAA